MRTASIPRSRLLGVVPKAAITLGLLILLRLGFQVPVPGLSSDFLVPTREQVSLFGLLSTVSGGAIGQTAIFGLGLLPYLTACLAVWLISKLSSRVRAIPEHEPAREVILKRWTRLAVVPIAAIQALVLFLGVFQRHAGAVNEGARLQPLALGLVTVVSLVAGAIAVLWIAETITRKGLGNGVVLVIAAGIIARFDHALVAVVGTEDAWPAIAFMAATWVVTVAALTCVYKLGRRALAG